MSRQRGVPTREQCVELAPRTDDHSERFKRASAQTGSTYLAPHFTGLDRTAGEDRTSTLSSRLCCTHTLQHTHSQSLAITHPGAAINPAPPLQLLAIDLQQLGDCLSALPLHQLLGLEPHYLEGCEPAAAAAPAASGVTTAAKAAAPALAPAQVAAPARLAVSLVPPVPIPVPVLVTPAVAAAAVPVASPAAVAAASGSAVDDGDEDAELAALLTGRPVVAAAKPGTAAAASGAVGIRPAGAGVSLPASLQPRPVGLPAATAVPVTVKTVGGPVAARLGTAAAAGMPVVPKIVAGLPVRVAGGVTAGTGGAASPAAGLAAGAGKAAAGSGAAGGAAAGAGMDDELRLLLGLPPAAGGAVGVPMAGAAAAAPPRAGLPQAGGATTVQQVRSGCKPPWRFRLHFETAWQCRCVLRRPWCTRHRRHVPPANVLTGWRPIRIRPCMPIFQYDCVSSFAGSASRQTGHHRCSGGGGDGSGPGRSSWRRKGRRAEPR